jgi:hypothetical protein
MQPGIRLTRGFDSAAQNKRTHCDGETLPHIRHNPLHGDHGWKRFPHRSGGKVRNLTLPVWCRKMHLFRDGCNTFVDEMQFNLRHGGMWPHMLD